MSCLVCKKIAPLMPIILGVIKRDMVGVLVIFHTLKCQLQRIVHCIFKKSIYVFLTKGIGVLWWCQRISNVEFSCISGNFFSVYRDTKGELCLSAISCNARPMHNSGHAILRIFVHNSNKSHHIRNKPLNLAEMQFE